MSRNGLRGNQRGMVSFMVTLIMMMVITLIVIGFAQVTRRNEREALDRQLGTQAFYAAESGINVNKTKIANFIAANGYAALPNKTACANDYDPTNVATGQSSSPIVPIDATSDITYTCVFVDPTPDKLTFTGLAAGQSTVVPLVPDTSNFPSLTITWAEQTGLGAAADADCATARPVNYLPPQTTWACGNALLRIDLVSNPAAGNLTSANNRTVYLSPYGSHGSNTLTADTAQFMTSTVCTTTCTVTFTGVGTGSFLARITPIYRSVPTLTIASPVGFRGAQAVIDVTGRAQDQLRRVQANVALSSFLGSDDIPLNALMSKGDVCKKINVGPAPPALSTIDFTNTCN